MYIFLVYYLDGLVHVTVAQRIERDFKGPPNRIQVVFNNLEEKKPDEYSSQE